MRCPDPTRAAPLLLSLTLLASSGCDDSTSDVMAPDDGGLIAVSGLSALDDTPEEGALGSNPSLIDGNLTASAGINLGVPPPGGDDSPRNIGLEFSSDTQVNRLYVWVDLDLPSDIGFAFSWTVYISEDNMGWTLSEVIGLDAYDWVHHRFVMNFSDVATRYIKVVVDPLSPAMPFASGFPEIYVTEIQAIAVAGRHVQESTHHR